MINSLIIATVILFASTQFVVIFGAIYGGNSGIPEPIISADSSVKVAQSDFAVALMKKMMYNGRTLIASPISISTALFMIYLAADGETKHELRDVLAGNAKEAAIRKYFGTLLANKINKKYKKNGSCTVDITNRLCIPRGFSIKPSFPHTYQYFFDEKLHEFNTAKSNQLVKEINSWISEKSSNEITKLMETVIVNSDTEMLVLNTFQFKGIWTKQFSHKETHKEIFYFSHNIKRELYMMKLRATLPYYEDNYVRVVKLPYVADYGSEIEMVIILPKICFDLQKVRAQMTPEILNAYIKNALPAKVELKLPKFRIQEEWNLEDTLSKLGITNIFSKKANFNKLTDDSISVSNIVHKVIFQVTEEGTGNIHAKEYNSADSLLQDCISFSVNQPFLFFVVKDLNTILLAGQYGQK